MGQGITDNSCPIRMAISGNRRSLAEASLCLLLACSRRDQEFLADAEFGTIEAGICSDDVFHGHSLAPTARRLGDVFQGVTHLKYIMVPWQRIIDGRSVG
jgi:hypothetical protein